MPKIPQGEWSAIAARYEKGESMSGIARGYGCTPPAIHYILKRHRQLPPTAVRPLSAACLQRRQPRRSPLTLPSRPRPGGSPANPSNTHRP